MSRRLALQTLLQSIIGARLDGKANVYYQPPSTITMNYPCIVYGRSSADTKFANDSPYLHRIQYDVTVIDKNPDSEIPEKIAVLPLCLFDRAFAANNLNHNVYNLYY